jgi:uroporphyrinogen decarboxylase
MAAVRREMRFKPDFERFRKVMFLQQPDRVPLAEVLISDKIKSKFLGKEVKDDDMEAQVEFWSSAGYDFIPVVAGMLGPGRVTDATKIYAIVRHSLFEDDEKTKGWAAEGKGIITSMEEFEKFPWVSANDLDYTKFDTVQEHLPEGMKIILVSGKIFTITWILMGFEVFCMSFITNESLIKKLFEKIGTIQFEAFQKSIEQPNVGAVWVVDDVAYDAGLMISPNYLRKYLFPWYDRMAMICKKRDIPFIFHSDGNLWKIMDDIVAMGSNAIHPIEPKAMDINEVKAKFGDRLALIGNVDLDKLARGTKEEVIDETKKRLREVGSNGGYCIGSSNSIPEWVNYENYIAMIDTAARFGDYPMSIG